MRTTMEFKAGRLLCHHIRDFLNGLKFKGNDLDFMESSEFFQRTFYIKGEVGILNGVRYSLEKWAKENNLRR